MDPKTFIYLDGEGNIISTVTTSDRGFILNKDLPSVQITQIDSDLVINNPDNYKYQKNVGKFVAKNA